MQEIQIDGDEELRLLQFFRCLSPSQRGHVLESIGPLAIDRCKADWSVSEVMPPTPIDFEQVFEEAKFAIGEPEEVLLSMSDFENSSTLNEFYHRLVEAADDRGLEFVWDTAWVARYLRSWSLAIAASCYRSSLFMAKSIVEAEAQDAQALARTLDWQEFILSLDGERINNQLDGYEPGTFDADLRSHILDPGPLPSIAADWFEPAQDVPISHVLSVRLALYDKLRYLQRKKAWPPSERVVQEIRDAIAWIASGGTDF